MTERFAELLRCAANARRAGLDALADHLSATAELHRPAGMLTDKARARARRRRAVAGPAVGGAA